MTISKLSVGIIGLFLTSLPIRAEAINGSDSGDSGLSNLDNTTLDAIVNLEEEEACGLMSATEAALYCTEPLANPPSPRKRTTKGCNDERTAGYAACKGLGLTLIAHPGWWPGLCKRACTSSKWLGCYDFCIYDMRTMGGVRICNKVVQRNWSICNKLILLPPRNPR